MFKDKSGTFEDFGFKLVVINSLLGKKTSFSEKLEEMKIKYVNKYLNDMYEYDDGFECLPEMVEYFENLKLTKDDLALVKELVFDGGNDIYFLIMPYWDGESNEFDVVSIKGFEKLPNLEEVIYVAMCEENLMDGFSKNGIKIL